MDSGFYGLLGFAQYALRPGAISPERFAGLNTRRQQIMLRAIGLRPIRPLARGYLTVRRADRTSLRLDTSRGTTRICGMR